MRSTRLLVRSLPGALLLVLVFALVPAVAPAATRHLYVEGASSPLHMLRATGVALTPLTDDVVEPLPANAAVLSFGIAPVLGATSPGYGGTPPDPRSLQLLPGGHLLVADRNSSLVSEFDAAGRAVWAYSPADARGDESPLVKPFSARRFTRLGQSLTLICDRNGKRVFVVDASKRVVWQYGRAMASGNGIDRLVDPFYAEYVPAGDPANDTILITEDKSVDSADPAQQANRVIEVRYADYRAGAANDGFSERSIVWRYGSGVDGSGVDELFKPHSAQRLANGNTLIVDADNDRVIEVRTEDYDPSLPDDGYHGGAHPSVVWQYGVTGVQGGDPGRPAGPEYLADPNYAERLADGHTLIADTGHNRVIDVDSYGDARVVQLDRPHQPVDPGVEPRALTREEDGALLIADSAKNHVLRAGFLGAGTASGRIIGTAVGRALDCGRPQWGKRFLSISWGADRPTGSGLQLYYRIDPVSPGSVATRDGRPTGAGWLTAGTSGTFALPAGSIGKTIQYFVRLSTTDRSVTPALTSVSIEYTRWAGPSDKKKESPAAPVGAAWMGGPTQQTGGLGTAGGGVGYRSGSGGGSGGGFGSTAWSGTGANNTTALEGTASAAQSPGQASAAGNVPDMAESAGAARPVTGVVVGAGSVGGGSPGGGGSVATQHTARVALWAAVGAGMLLLAWLVVAAAERRRKALIAYDHTARTRPRGGLPLLRGLP